ncbi:protein [Escherichia coli]|uniref:Protein n=1 Tax=Escherichia coli TaxID=562 RepID=A0A376TIH2_ECOLX|nr:protein [Escherichia coli]
MFRPFLNSLMLGSLLFPFIAIAGSTAQGGVIHFLWPNCGTGM